MTARTSYFAPALLAGLFLACGAAQVVGQQPASNGPATIDMTVVKPESVGFSSERLERLHALMQQVVDQKQLPGAVTLLARHGKVIDYRTYGMRDAASGAPMTRDAAAPARPPKRDAPNPRLDIFFRSRLGVNPPFLIRYSSSRIWYVRLLTKYHESTNAVNIYAEGAWSAALSPSRFCKNADRRLFLERAGLADSFCEGLLFGCHAIALADFSART